MTTAFIEERSPETNIEINDSGEVVSFIPNLGKFATALAADEIHQIKATQESLRRLETEEPAVAAHLHLEMAASAHQDLREEAASFMWRVLLSSNEEFLSPEVQADIVEAWSGLMKDEDYIGYEARQSFSFADGRLACDAAQRKHLKQIAWAHGEFYEEVPVIINKRMTDRH